MAKPRINYMDAYRVLGGVNDADRLKYEYIRRKMGRKEKLTVEEKTFVTHRCEQGRLLREQAAEEGFARLFSVSND